MRRRVSVLLLAIVLCGVASKAGGQDARHPMDIYFFDEDPPAGALIFQQRAGLEGEAIRLATGSPYTHVGLIRVTGGGPYVMQSSAATKGVDEVPMEEFIDAGVDRKFAIYVSKDVRRPPSQLNHPVSLAAFDYFLRPYDAFYDPDPEALYGAELVYAIFSGLGHPIGALQRIGDLDFDTPEGRELLLKNWRRRPECRGRDMTREACWVLIQRTPIVTPKSLSDDPALELYLSTF